MIGLLIESRGPSAAIGDFCEVLASSGRRIRTQVIGFRNGRVLSMPLEEIDGLQLGDAMLRAQPGGRSRSGPWIAGPRDRRFRQAHRRRPAHCSRGHLRSVRQGHQPAGPRAHHPAAGHRHPRHRRPAAVRQRAAHRDLRRQRRGQEHAARVHGAPQFGRRDRDRHDRRAQPRSARLSRKRAGAGGPQAVGGGVRHVAIGPRRCACAPVLWRWRSPNISATRAPACCW